MPCERPKGLPARQPSPWASLDRPLQTIGKVLGYRLVACWTIVQPHPSQHSPNTTEACPVVPEEGLEPGPMLFRRSRS
jgi:hypothetical protein